MQRLCRLARQPDVPTSAIILSTSSMMQPRILACQLSDGSIEFRDRTLMDLINPDYADNSVDSFPQTGFSFPLAEPGKYLDIRLSTLSDLLRGRLPGIFAQSVHSCCYSEGWLINLATARVFTRLPEHC